MFFGINLNDILEIIRLSICLFMLTGGIILSFKTRFIQFRAIPLMLKLFWNNIFKKNSLGKDTIGANRALLTAMSTSIGLGNVVFPVIAIKLGGPGALLGYFLATIFGAASTFSEVTCALKNRVKNQDGTISGGPMQYIQKALSPSMASLYAFSACITMVIWSANQANTLADLLQPRGIPTYVTGIVLAILVLFILLGGIQRLGLFSLFKVPMMFAVYFSATLWIVLNNLSKLPEVFKLIFKSAFTTQAIAGAGVAYGLSTAMRWGLAKGFFANESGLGTATIPHSKAENSNPITQGILSMVGVYTNGILCWLSGLTVLLTGTWLSTDAGIGINIMAKSFTMYFSYAGIFILLFCVLLFSIGAVFGNSYNGSQCFLYATKNKYIKYYFVFVALIVFLGAIMDVEFLANITDFFLIPIAIPNLLAVLILVFKDKNFIDINRDLK